MKTMNLDCHLGSLTIQGEEIFLSEHIREKAGKRDSSEHRGTRLEEVLCCSLGLFCLNMTYTETEVIKLPIVTC